MEEVDWTQRPAETHLLKPTWLFLILQGCADSSFTCCPLSRRALRPTLPYSSLQTLLNSSPIPVTAFTF